MFTFAISTARRLRTVFTLVRSRCVTRCGNGVHIGANARLWAPDGIAIGDNVYLGKDVHIECNAELGDHALVANRVAFVGRHDHDMRTVGVPVRFATWIGDRRPDDKVRRAKVIVEKDVWIGFGAVVLSGVTIHRGAIVAAGAVVREDVEAYSIVAGNPAVPVGSRFSAADVLKHEESMDRGRFVFSEFGKGDCIIAPADSGQDPHSKSGT